MAIEAHHLAAPELWEYGSVNRFPGAESFLNLTYAAPLGWRPLRLDLHLPAKRTGPVPVVVYAHGGSFIGGVKELGPWALLPGQGIAVASVEYRLAGEASYPEPIEDVLAAVRWVRGNAATYGLDPLRIAGWGSSAGGYLMARAAVADDHAVGRPIGDFQDVSAKLSSVVLHYPVTDFGSLLEDAFEPTEASQAGVIDVVSRFFGYPMDQVLQLIEEASVPEAAGRAAWLPPMLVSHGDGDHRCGVAQSRRLAAAWEMAGGQSRLDIVPGADHAAPVFSEEPLVQRAVDHIRNSWSHDKGAQPPERLAVIASKGPSTHDDDD